jgi:MinD superfamily P-loop ATPase
MEPSDLQRAWVRQAQLDAERGVVECRVCRTRAELDRVITVWRNGVLAFALCDGCGATHEVVVRPVEAGLEIRARARHPVVLIGAAR